MTNKRRINVQTNYGSKLNKIHGEASSSTLVEDLASHAKGRHNRQKIKDV
jgi:hypothetical protein